MLTSCSLIPLWQTLFPSQSDRYRRPLSLTSAFIHEYCAEQTYRPIDSYWLQYLAVGSLRGVKGAQDIIPGGYTEGSSVLGVGTAVEVLTTKRRDRTAVGRVGMVWKPRDVRTAQDDREEWDLVITYLL